MDGLQETSKKATNAKIVKLVEMICVETRFITQNQIKNNFECTTLFDNLISPSDNQVVPQKRKSENVPPPATKVQIIPANGNLQPIKLPVQPAITSAKSDKELPVNKPDLQITAVHENIKCISCLRRESKTYSTVATQYELMEDLAIPMPVTKTVEQPVEDFYESFQSFIAAKILTYDNDMHECLICGEVSKGLTELSAHMVLHYGPSALCTKCGRLFDHMFLMWHHHCKMSLKRRRRPGSLLCMHTLCPVFKIMRKNQKKTKYKRYCQRDAYGRSGCKRWFKRIFRSKNPALVQIEADKLATEPTALRNKSKSPALPEIKAKSPALPEIEAKSADLPQNKPKSPELIRIAAETVVISP